MKEENIRNGEREIHREEDIPEPRETEPQDRDTALGTCEQREEYHCVRQEGCVLVSTLR